MTHQLSKYRAFSFALVAAIVFAIVPTTAQARPAAQANSGECTYHGPGNISCDYDQIEAGDDVPAWAPPILYVFDYAEALAGIDNPLIVDGAPGSGTVSLSIPSLGLQPITLRECPLNEVIRSPYPRALTTVPVEFNLLPNDTPAVNFASAGPPAKNGQYIAEGWVGANGVMHVHGAAGLLTLTVRGTRLSGGSYLGTEVISPTWDFQDRLWNWDRQYPHGQMGITTTFAYRTSSYGLPEKGRALTISSGTLGDVYNLPAYFVKQETPCKYEVQVTVQKSYPYWKYTNPDQTAGEWREQWVDVVSPWRNVDMRDYGYPQPYEMWPKVRSGGIFRGVLLWEPTPRNIWVPVLEMQSTLRSTDCGVSGNCPPTPGDALTTEGTGATSVTYDASGMP